MNRDRSSLKSATVRPDYTVPVGCFSKMTRKVVTETVYRHVIVPAIQGGATVLDSVFDDD